MPRRRRRHATRPADRAVGYVRASTSGQVLTVGAQRRKLEQWAEANGIELLEVYTDRARSGSLELERREGWTALVEGVVEHNAGAVLVVARSRVARSMYLAHQAERELELRGSRIVDLETAHLGEGHGAELTRRILDVFAEDYRRVCSINTKRVHEDLRARGKRWTGRPPYGYRWTDGELKAVELEQKALRQLARWRARGNSIRRCRELLEEKGHPPRGAGWHLTSVARIVRRLEAMADD
jgi:site-specific DNA recombinase